MVRYIFFSLTLLAPLALISQTDSLSVPTSISRCRQALIQAFDTGDRVQTQYWLDSLRRLEDDRFLALEWDERWLLYIWLEKYTPLLAEAGLFTSGLEADMYLKMRPPQDSLFDVVDNRLFNDQAYLFDQIQKGLPSTEERAFTTLLLQYLLRLNVSEQDKRAYDDQLSSFLKQYPKSRFSSFIRARMYNTLPPANWALGLDLLFLQGNWSDGLERSFNPSFGGELGVSYWQKRINVNLQLAIGGQKLLRDIEENGYFWPRHDGSTFFAMELEGGYDVYNTAKLRIFPTIGGGFSSLRPPENEENPNPDYYDNFRFNGWHWLVAVQADVKLGSGEKKVATSYHGIRVRMGHRWLNLSADNPAIQGNMFFFAVGFTLFSRQAR